MLRPPTKEFIPEQKVADAPVESKRHYRASVLSTNPHSLETLSPPIFTLQKRDQLAHDHLSAAVKRFAAIDITKLKTKAEQAYYRKFFLKDILPAYYYFIDFSDQQNIAEQRTVLTNLFFRIPNLEPSEFFDWTKKHIQNKHLDIYFRLEYIWTLITCTIMGKQFNTTDSIYKADLAEATLDDIGYLYISKLFSLGKLPGIASIFLKNAADKFDVEAMQLLAAANEHGYGIPVNPEMAGKLYLDAWKLYFQHWLDAKRTPLAIPYTTMSRERNYTRDKLVRFPVNRYALIDFYFYDYAQEKRINNLLLLADTLANADISDPMFQQTLEKLEKLYRDLPPTYDAKNLRNTIDILLETIPDRSAEIRWCEYIIAKEHSLDFDFASHVVRKLENIACDPHANTQIMLKASSALRRQKAVINTLENISLIVDITGKVSELYEILSHTQTHGKTHHTLFIKQLNDWIAASTKHQTLTALKLEDRNELFIYLAEATDNPYAKAVIDELLSVWLNKPSLVHEILYRELIHRLKPGNYSDITQINKIILALNKAITSTNLPEIKIVESMFSMPIERVKTDVFFKQLGQIVIPTTEMKSEMDGLHKNEDIFRACREEKSLKTLLEKDELLTLDYFFDKTKTITLSQAIALSLKIIILTLDVEHAAARFHLPVENIIEMHQKSIMRLTDQFTANKATPVKEFLEFAIDLASKRELIPVLRDVKTDTVMSAILEYSQLQNPEFYRLYQQGIKSTYSKPVLSRMECEGLAAKINKTLNEKSIKLSASRMTLLPAPSTTTTQRSVVTAARSNP